MKNFYYVSFKYSESVFCSNIAKAETAEDVETYYGKFLKYEWVSVREASSADVKTAERKGMPFTEVPQRERVGTLARDLMAFFFDVDPWNGSSESEMMESVVNSLTGDASAVLEDLWDVIDGEGYEDFRQTARHLKERVSFYLACR